MVHPTVEDTIWLLSIDTSLHSSVYEDLWWHGLSLEPGVVPGLVVSALPGSPLEIQSLRPRPRLLHERLWSRNPSPPHDPDTHWRGNCQREAPDSLMLQVPGMNWHYTLSNYGIQQLSLFLFKIFFSGIDFCLYYKIESLAWGLVNVVEEIGSWQDLGIIDHSLSHVPPDALHL